MMKNFWILIVVIFCGFSALSQDMSAYGSGFKVNQLTDQQILQIWNQTQRNGISESDAIKLLVKRGLDPTEVNSFKRRILMIQQSNRSKISNQSIITDSSSFLRDSSWVIEIPLSRKKSRNFGFDFFNNPFISFDPNTRIATPKNYILGPDDELEINVTGLNENVFRVSINPNGQIQLPYAGLVQLNGLTIEQATSKIKSQLQKVYPAMSSGKTQLNVTLTNLRSIRVSIVGEAEKPGTYMVNAAASLFNVLYLSGGPSENGSLRYIELIRNNKVVEVIDFYSFLTKGILNKNLRLEDQDIIRFPIYTKRVLISGAIKRPAIYELKPSESLQQLIDYAGGFGDSAYTERIKVVQIGSMEKLVRDVSKELYADFIPRNADSIFIENILDRYTNRVNIEGAVLMPGNYELTEGLTLTKLISKSLGLRPDAVLTKGYIKRRNEDLSRAIVSFNLQSIQQGLEEDIKLQKEDSVMVFSKDSLRDVATITITGNVRKPGIYEYRKGMKLSDIIVMAGGFTDEAAMHRVEVSRIEKNNSDTLANQLVDVVTVEIDSTFSKGNHQLALEPYSYIFVPRLVNYRSLGQVAIKGEVLFPGNYKLERRDETLNELLQRAGGISKFGAIKDAQVFRNGLRVAIDLTVASNRAAFKMLSGDSVYVPRSEPFVQVLGAVNNPQIINFSGGSFKGYISAAGGIKENAYLKRAYVQYGNGMSKQVGKFLFFRIYPRVTPGSKIVVPERAEPKRRLSIGEVSAITGVFTSLISLIAILQR